MSPDGSKSPPEERLLKLIRGKGPTPSSPAQAPPPLSAAEGGSAQRAGAVGPDIGGGVALPRGVRLPFVVALDMSSWSMRLVQGMLGMVIAGELIMLVVLLVRPSPTMLAPVLPVTAAAASTGDELTTPVPSISAEVSRPLFATSTSSVPAGGLSLGSGGPSENAKALAARLTLLGIMGGDTPQAIIEDSQTKKTFSVTVGQSLVDGLVVSKIADNRVVLDLNGEAIELSL